MTELFFKTIKSLPLSDILKKIPLLIILLYPFIVPQQKIFLGFIALQYVLFAFGLNIVVGWTGLLDLGAAGFVAVGAYTAAILMTHFGCSVLLVLPITFVIGFMAGVLLGLPTLRHRSDYFAILTLGFAELVALGIRNWPSVTRGSYGYSGIPPTILPFLKEPLHAVPPVGYYYLALAVAIPAFFFVGWLRKTSLGRYFHVVKHSEKIGNSYGINIIAVKIAAFGISAAFLSLGGLFWATYQRSIIWTEFGILLSCMLLSMLVIGGLGSINGIIIGALIIATSSELLRSFLTSMGLPQNIRFLIFSSIMILFIHMRPRGLIPDSPSWVGSGNHLNLNIFKPKAILHTKMDKKLKIADQHHLLQIDNISKSFGGIQAINGLSFHVKPGECIALIGPNGSGKTTLLNLVSGILKPDYGEIWYNGKQISGMPSYSIYRLGIGRSFQEISVFEDLSAQDNVYVTSYDASITSINSCLELFGLKGNSHCSSLSYGDKKALDMARLFVEPDALRLVLLDEPTAGLTQKEALAMVEVLLEIKKKNRMSMIIVSHDIMFLEALNIDRIIVLNRGELFKEGTFAGIRGDFEVTKLFWGE